jgi:hypothetical protein
MIYRLLFFVIAVFGLLPLAHAQQGTGAVPLPADVRVVPPDAAAPAEIARFSGAWEGSWNGALPTILVVQKIDHKQNRADLLYAVGVNTGANVNSSAWIRLEGRFEGGVLKATTRDGGWLSYTFTGDMLEATYQRGNSSRSKMSRFELKSPQ